MRAAIELLAKSLPILQSPDLYLDYPIFFVPGPGRYAALRYSCSFGGLKGPTQEGVRSASGLTLVHAGLTQEGIRGSRSRSRMTDAGGNSGTDDPQDEPASMPHIP